MTTTLLIPYGYDPREPNGWPYAWCTVDELETKVAWRRLHPEFKRRLHAIFAATAGPDGRCRLGIGGGWRSPQQQEATFRSRYSPGYRAAAKSRVYWANAPEGAGWWSINSNNLAPSTPPGLSWHEDAPEVDDGDPATSFAYACDTIGDWAYLAEHCAEYGLVEFEDVNDEPWHAQPKELPNARRSYTSQTLKVWALPNDHPIVIDPPVEVHPLTPTDPTAPTPEEDDDMKVLDYAKGTPSWVRVVLAGRLKWVRDQASGVVDRMQLDAEDVSFDELTWMIRSFGTEGPSPFDPTEEGHASYPGSDGHDREWKANRRDIAAD